MTDAVQTAIGGYLLVGISSSTQDNLKASITLSDTAFSFKKEGVFQDVLLHDINQQPINLGKSSNQYATAYSATSHNFILANTYNTTTSKSDILLMKVDNALVPLWGNAATKEPNFVSFGGDGDDTAGAVAELPDGRIMVLGTMQLGNPPAQFKIVLMKLNANGALSN